MAVAPAGKGVEGHARNGEAGESLVDGGLGWR